MILIKNLQKSLIEVLSTTENKSSSMLDKISGIYHFVPKNAAFPYIHLGQDNVTDLSNYSEKIYLINMKIYAYDRSTSNENILKLSEEIETRLIKIDGLFDDLYETLDVKLNDTLIELCDDGISWKAEMDYNFIIKEI